MRQIVLFIFIFCSFSTLAADFDLSNTVKDEKKLEQFILNMTKVVEFNSSTEFQEYLVSNTHGLYINKVVRSNPIISEFGYRAMQNPKSVTSFISVFFDYNKLILFSVFMVGTLILSHYMGEIKFRFKALSNKRLAYSFLRFSSINALRIWVFVVMFKTNFSPITKVFMNAAHYVQDGQPVVFKISTLISSIIG